MSSEVPYSGKFSRVQIFANRNFRGSNIRGSVPGNDIHPYIALHVIYEFAWDLINAKCCSSQNLTKPKKMSRYTLHLLYACTAAAWLYRVHEKAGN